MALTRTAIPPGARLTIELSDDEVAHKVGLTLAAMPREIRLCALVMLAAFEWLACLRFLKRFSSLDPGLQSRWLDSWVESRFMVARSSARALLTVVKPVHFANARVHQQLLRSSQPKPALPPPAPIGLPPQQVITSIPSDRKIRTQAVVIGTGAGGAVVAAEMAEAGIDVVLIETGRFHSSSKLGGEALATMQETYVDGAATMALGRPPIPLPLGQTVGGTTTINSGTCFRTPERILDKWADMGLKVDRLALGEAFERVEERISVRPVPSTLLGGSSHVIARGAEALGLEHGPLQRNIGECRMSARCVLGCPRDAKQSMNITYVPRALTHGAMLYTGFKAEKITTREGRASGIIARSTQGGQTLTVEADIVVSACGAIGGVPFLSKSGIDSRHLGRHLSIHPAGKIAALMPDAVHGWRDTPQGYGIYELFDQGIMFEGAFVPPELASIAFPFVGQKFTSVMEQYENIAMFGLLVADDPNGRVWVGPNGRPVITYWMSKTDLERMRIGLSLLSDVFFAAGARRIFLPIAGYEEQNSLDSAKSVLQRPLDPWRLELAAFHPLGTARMSENTRDGVVKTNLESWSLPGLYVVDGSVFPTSLGVNPQLTIMAFATMAGQRIAAHHF